MCLERIVRNRDNIELFEEEQRLEKVREQYLALKMLFGNTFVVAGNRAKEEIATEIWGIVERMLVDP